MSCHALLMENYMEKCFSEIKTRNEFADFLKIERRTLTFVLYSKGVDSYYTSFEIPKKSGESRTIMAPTGVLKTIQRKLSLCLYNYRTKICSDNNIKLNISHGFEKGKSIITNSKIHKNKRYIVNVDLKDFFESFHFGRVRGYFINNKYFKMNEEVATIIAQLTCCNGKLPQGAPTSPIITNLICQVLDYKLLGLSKKYRLDFTRYADDMTFSTNDKTFVEKYDSFIKDLNKVIVKNGFSVNDSKTRLIFKDSKQTVTGLVVNEKVNVDRHYYKKVRSMAHHLYTEGKFYLNDKEGTTDELEGMFSFINEIEKYNNGVTCDNKKTFYNLNNREKEFQKFLFFKYFYSNSKPLIVTEGKTDISYIKAALKNLYKEYPELIEKKENGEFEFKVSFFKRSKRIRYFFNMSLDGADAMKNLYRFFTNIDNNSYQNYFDYFMKISKIKAKNPVLMIFDNELSNKSKPLKKFLNITNFSNEYKSEIENGGYIQLVDGSNLYLATHQLVNNKEECEIEDLFDDNILKHKISGKSFSRESNFNSDKHYGKEIFSKYILSNYERIDFSNFIPLLNSIKEIVENYNTN